MTAALAATAVPAAAAEADSPPSVYQVALNVRFDSETAVIRGSERLRWNNTSSVPIDDLRFHLYLNAFANNRSTFMRESGGQLRGDEFDEERFGYSEVTSIRVRGPAGPDLKPGEEFVAPDDGNPDDRTVVRYPLPEPLLPGGWITLDIEFESRLPSIFARTGVQGDFVLAGQWFPKIAVFEDAGVRGRREPGWNAHQFHARSEFYADFGDYDVTITLPSRYAGRVGATGRRTEVAEPPDPPAGPDEVTVRFVQHGVIDFAWTADPRFVVMTDTFDPAWDVPAAQRGRIAGLLGVDESELALGQVDITLLVSPANASQADRYLASAKAAIAGYGLRLGAYPYATLTLVDAPLGATGAGGMEYPTFITLGTWPLLGLPPLDGLLVPELVTVHEYGHQYFMGLLASNEFEEAWLDEGINSYYEMVVMDEVYGGRTIDVGEIRTSSFDLNHAQLGKGFRDPVVAPAWRYYSGGSYGQNSYPRSAVTLRHLENLLGEPTFHRAMRAYYQRFHYRHPSTADFERTIEEVSGRDLGWFFRQALHSTRSLDYSVRLLRNTRFPERKGFFWRDGERSEVGLDEEDEETDEGEDGEPPKRWRAEAIVYREGEFVHPVTVEFRFDDDRTVRREWAGATRWARWTFTGPAKLVSVEVDPDQVMALDLDRLNNGRRDEPDPAPALALVTDVLYWLQTLFHATSWLA